MTLSVAVLAHARHEVEKLLTDTLRIRRPVDNRTRVLDPDTDQLSDPAPGAIAYQGPGLIGLDTRLTHEPEQGGAKLAVEAWHARLPAQTEDVLVGDSVEVLASRDPDLVGAVFAVTLVGGGTHRLTRQLLLGSVTRKPRWP